MSSVPKSERDQLGAARLMTAETMQAAMNAAYPFNRIIPLGIHVTDKTPAWGGRTHKVIIKAVATGNEKPVTTFLDDRMEAGVGIGTHVDALGHVQVDGKYHSDFTHSEVFSKDGLQELAIPDNITHFIARCKIIDMAKHYGVDVIDGGTAFSQADLEGAMKEQEVTIEKGDVVILHSGWMAHLDDADTFNASEPGIGLEAAKYLASLGVLMVAGDTWALEAYPHEGNRYPVHVELLKKNGIYIGEMFDTGKLVAAGVKEGTIVIAVPQSLGLCQARTNPIVFA